VILRRGPANYPINFSFDRRNDISLVNELGTSLSKLFTNQLMDKSILQD